MIKYSGGTKSPSENLITLLELFSVRYNTDNAKCCYTFQDGTFNLHIPVDGVWYPFTFDNADINRNADTLFNEIVKML